MGQDGHAVADQFRAVPADFLAMADIFVGKMFGGGERERLLFRHRFTTRHGAAHAVHRVDGINGGGARGGERLLDRCNVLGNDFMSWPRKASAPCAKP